MKDKIKQLIYDNRIKIIIRAHLFIFLLFFIFIIFKWSSLPPQLPLFYSLPKGEEQLGNPLQFLLLPFFSLLIFGINFTLAAYFYPKERLFSVLMAVISLISSFLLLITFIKIIFLIT